MNSNVPLWHKTVLNRFRGDVDLFHALDHYNQVMEKFDKNSDEVVSVQIQIGKLLIERGEFLESLGILNEARGILQDRKESLHPLMAEVLAAIGDYYLLQGMHNESLPYLEKALSVREALCISDNEESARLFMKTGEVYATSHDLSGAEDFFNRAFQVAQEICPDDATINGDICNNLGIVLTSKNEIDRAVTFFKKAVEYRKQEYGPRHEEAALAYLTLANSYEKLNMTMQQAECYYKAIEIREELYGVEDPTVNALKDKYLVLVQILEASNQVQPKQKESLKVQKNSTCKGSKCSVKTGKKEIQLARALAKVALIAIEAKNLEVAKSILNLVESVNSDKIISTEITKEKAEKIFEIIQNDF
jgi:tetratricopeptide (TPR) repeat protein